MAKLRADTKRGLRVENDGIDLTRSELALLEKGRLERAVMQLRRDIEDAESQILCYNDLKHCLNSWADCIVGYASSLRLSVSARNFIASWSTGVYLKSMHRDGRFFQK